MVKNITAYSKHTQAHSCPPSAKVSRLLSHNPNIFWHRSQPSSVCPALLCSSSTKLSPAVRLSSLGGTGSSYQKRDKKLVLCWMWGCWRSKGGETCAIVRSVLGRSCSLSSSSCYSSPILMLTSFFSSLLKCPEGGSCPLFGGRAEHSSMLENFQGESQMGQGGRGWGGQQGCRLADSSRTMLSTDWQYFSIFRWYSRHWFGFLLAMHFAMPLKREKRCPCPYSKRDWWYSRNSRYFCFSERVHCPVLVKKRELPSREHPGRVASCEGSALTGCCMRGWGRSLSIILLYRHEDFISTRSKQPSINLIEINQTGPCPGRLGCNKISASRGGLLGINNKMESVSKWQHPNLLLSIKSSEPTLNAGMSRYPVVREAAGKLGIQISEDSYNLLWCDHPLSVREIKAQEQGTKVNHLPEVTTITRKNRLAAHLNSLRLHFPKDYLFAPETWLLPSDIQRLLKKHSKGKVYIVKPENGCQGQGIYLTSDPWKLEQERNVIVQEYVSNPLLIGGLKFDLRVYVLITCIQPLRIFMYGDGIARLATETFQRPDEANLGNHFAHLTNYAINRQHHSFSIEEGSQGHKRLITSVFRNEDYSALMEQVAPIVIKTVIAGLPTMQNGLAQCKRADPSSCFQLLGFDILLNQKRQPLLLEVNQNPSLNTDTPFDHKLKSQLVRNILEMTTGGYRCSPEDKFETKMKLKDRHEWATRGNFTKIYPCESLQLTERYDSFMAKATALFRERYGINVLRVAKRSKNLLKQEDSLAWNEQPSHYNHSKIQKVYAPPNLNSSLLNTRSAKSSTHKKRLIFL